mgnify:CR=1 FL=1
MNRHIFRRGNLYLKRNLSKAITLFLIVFLLGNVFSASLSLRQTSSQAEAALLSKFKVIAWVETNYDSSKYPDDEFPKISETTYMELAALPEVSFYDYSVGMTPPLENGDDLYLVGTEHYEPLDFFLGINYLTEGRLFTEEEVQSGAPFAVISETAANERLLKVGDEVSLTYDVAMLPQYNKAYKDPNRRTFVFTVIGIFRTAEDQVSTRDIYMPNDALIDEVIFIDTEFRRSLGDELDPEEGNRQFYYALHGPQSIPSFQQAASRLIGDNFKMVFSTDQLEHYTGPIKATRHLSGLVFWLSSVVAITVLLFIILIFMHSRKFEIGIYLSLGVKRPLLYAQSMYEILAVVVAALLPAFFTGQYFSKELVNSLLAKLAKNSPETNFPSKWGNVSLAEAQNLFKASSPPSVVLYYLATGIGLALIAVAISLLYIYRVNPKEIMLEEQS